MFVDTSENTLSVSRVTADVADVLWNEQIEFQTITMIRDRSKNHQKGEEKNKQDQKISTSKVVGMANR